MSETTPQPTLNRNQKKFCKISPKKNIRLLAPAGSGKTYSLLWRCHFITAEYQKAEKPAPNFLIITFTRSAKCELENRIKQTEEFQTIRATVSTLNAWGWDLLKTRTGKELVTGRFALKNLVNHDLLPICKKYERIYGLIKNARGQAVNAPIIMDLIDQLKSLGFTHFMGKRDFNAHVRYLKELGLYPMFFELFASLLKLEKISYSSKIEQEDAVWEFFTFWKAAVKQLEENNRFTFEDQKYWARIMLEERVKEGKFAHSNAAFTHIFVDEFQDINPLDLALINAISMYHGKGKQISTTIVGDDDQAIFGWRGTTPKFILDPDKYLGIKFETCVLDTNYRSPKNIVETSGQLISYNKNRVAKEMKSAAKGKSLIKVVSKKKMITTIEATAALTHELLEKKGCKSVALIGRKQAALFPYQVLFSAENTKYHVAADLDIFEGEAMKSLQAILQIIYRAKDDDCDDPVEHLLTICDKVDRFQIQNKEKQTLKNYLERQNADSFLDALEALRNYPDCIKNQSTQFLYDAVSALYHAPDVYSFMEQVLEKLKGFEQDYLKADSDNHYKNPQFIRLKELAKKYGTNYRQFYKDIEKARKNGEYSRKRDTDDSGEGYKETNEIKIHLVTATRSKGHEYDAVIILDADANEWPNQLSNDIEEERRLFYVAMTRAKKYLYFMTSNENTPSRFLLEAKVI